jgi:hypothetical protein
LFFLDHLTIFQIFSHKSRDRKPAWQRSFHWLLFQTCSLSGSPIK